MLTRNHLLSIGKCNGHTNGLKVNKLCDRIEGRGKSVVCEAIVPGKLIKEVNCTSPWLACVHMC